MAGFRGVAVLGIGCRMPGADGVEAFWELLCAGGDAISTLPSDRLSLNPLWQQAGSGTSAQQGGFVTDGDCFDAALFGIGEHEAERMDPQQGMLLETAWEALERAGIAPDSLAGTQTGVFVGIGNSDFDRLLNRNLRSLDLRAGTGTSYSIAANRLSYVLGLCGPSVAVDLACTSSLAAVHLAFQSLRSRECDLALAGGVHLILSPEKTLTFLRGGVLSAAGRCRSFSRYADGYVRGEGAGVIVMRRLADAERSGVPIMAVIRGTALNHNGRSNGLSAPFGAAQARVVRRALRVARVAPSTIGYVEAHSPGTALGDAIELGALKSVLGEHRDPTQMCLLGSVKTNLGHLEAAAGIASLAKALLAVSRGRIPESIAAAPLNDALRLDGAPLRVARALTEWPSWNQPRRAGVSCFSFGGANAHVVIEQAPMEKHGVSPRQFLPLLLLSAWSESALIRMSERYAFYCSGLVDRADSLSRFAAACYTACAARAHLPHRLAVIAGAPELAAQSLFRFHSLRCDDHVLSGTAPRRRARVVFVCGSSFEISETDRTFWTRQNPALGLTGQKDRSRGRASDASVGDRSIALATRVLRACGIVPDEVRRASDASCSGALTGAPGEASAEYPGVGAPSSPTVTIAIGAPPGTSSSGRTLQLTTLSPTSAEFARFIALAYLAGVAPRPGPLFGPQALESLPVYAFERRRHWRAPDGGPNV